MALYDIINSSVQELIAQSYNVYRLRQNAATRYGRIWRQFFPAKQSLATTVKALFGDAGLGVAPVVQWGSTAPEAAAQAGVEALFEVLPIEKRVSVDEKTIINLKNPAISEEQMLAEALDHVARVVGSVEARLDALAILAMSYGAITLDSTNNYGGTTVSIDFQVPSSRKVGVSNFWSDPTNAKPLDDIANWVSLLNADGAEQDLVLYMDSLTWKRFINTDQFKNLKLTAVASDYQLLAQGVNPIAQALAAQGFPLIVVVSGTTMPLDTSSGIVHTNLWKEGSCLLTYRGNLGNTMFTTYAELSDQNPTYNRVVVDGILVKTYRENNGVKEYFEAKANALPILTVSQDCVLANTMGSSF